MSHYSEHGARWVLRVYESLWILQTKEWDWSTRDFLPDRPRRVSRNFTSNKLCAKGDENCSASFARKKYGVVRCVRVMLTMGLGVVFPAEPQCIYLLGWHAMPTSTYDSIYARNFRKKREERLNRRAESKAKSCGTCVGAGAEMSTIFSPSHFPIIFANFRSNDRRWTSFIFRERREREGSKKRKPKGAWQINFPENHLTTPRFDGSEMELHPTYYVN